jgi:hypothetical protein
MFETHRLAGYREGYIQLSTRTEATTSVHILKETKLVSSTVSIRNSLVGVALDESYCDCEVTEVTNDQTDALPARLQSLLSTQTVDEDLSDDLLLTKVNNAYFRTDYFDMFRRYLSTLILVILWFLISLATQELL